MIVKNKEDFIRKIEGDKFIFIGGEYENQHSKFHIKDNEGYEYLVSPYSYNIYGVGHKFSVKNPFTVNNIKKYLTINNYDIELLSNRYKGNYDKLKWKCLKCDEIFEKSFNVIKRNEFKGLCNNCSRKKGQENHRVKDTLKQIENMGYIIMFGENGSHEDIIIMDKEGYLYNTTWNRLCNMSGKTLLKTYRGNQFNRYNLNIYIKNNNLNITLISHYYKDNCLHVIYKCNECNRVFDKKMVDFKELLNKCLYCKREISSLNKKTTQYLEERNIKYIKEFKFEDCKNNRQLPFDFYLPDYNICIECDGEQHYRPVDFTSKKDILSIEEDFKLIQYRDSIKNKYCEDNNIKLIRIPYWEFNDNGYINILNKEIYNI